MKRHIIKLLLVIGAVGIMQSCQDTGPEYPIDPPTPTEPEPPEPIETPEPIDPAPPEPDMGDDY